MPLNTTLYNFFPRSFFKRKRQIIRIEYLIEHFKNNKIDIESVIDNLIVAHKTSIGCKEFPKIYNIILILNYIINGITYQSCLKKVRNGENCVHSKTCDCCEYSIVGNYFDTAIYYSKCNVITNFIKENTYSNFDIALYTDSVFYEDNPKYRRQIINYKADSRIIPIQKAFDLAVKFYEISFNPTTNDTYYFNFSVNENIIIVKFPDSDIKRDCYLSLLSIVFNYAFLLTRKYYKEVARSKPRPDVALSELPKILIENGYFFDSYMSNINRDKGGELYSLITKYNYFYNYKCSCNRVTEVITNTCKKVFGKETYIAGACYNNADGTSRKENILATRNKSILRLKREKDNAFDENAIIILSADKQLGYVPKDIALNISRFSTNEFYLTATLLFTSCKSEIDGSYDIENIPLDLVFVYSHIYISVYYIGGEFQDANIIHHFKELF